MIDRYITYKNWTKTDMIYEFTSSKHCLNCLLQHVDVDQW